jgi:hypothetical protein
MIFPAFVYKSPGRKGKVKGKTYNWMPVANDEELQAALSKGWYATRDEAFNPVKKEIKAVVVEDAPPTRVELEQKARELGLKFDGRTSDKKLLKMIEGG